MKLRFTAFGTLITLLLVFPLRAKADFPTDYLGRELPEQWDCQSQYLDKQPDNDEWWKDFNDNVLDSLITVGLANNYNLAIAAKRIAVAENTMHSAASAYYPSLGLNAGWTKSRTSGMNGNEGAKASYASYFDLGLSLSWQIDLFGKITSQTREKNALYKASKAEFDGAMLSLAASIATNYFQLRVWQAELQVAKEHSERQQKVVAIAEARFECELASKLDVTQARGVYYSTLASVPVLENSINTAITSLAILVGAYPEDLKPLLSSPAPLPDYHMIIPVGVPADLIRRRPDIIAAEHEITAYAEALGVAKKDFLPTLTINGSIGTSAHRGGDLFSKESLGYTIAPTLSWTIFNGLQRKYNTAIAREQLEIGIDNYNEAVMNAVGDVDNAMSSYRAALLHIDALQLVMEQSNESLRLSIDLYKNSLTQFSNVVDAQMSVLENQNSLIVAHGQALNYIVSLYKAIGGGLNITVNN